MEFMILFAFLFFKFPAFFLALVILYIGLICSLVYDDLKGVDNDSINR